MKDDAGLPEGPLLLNPESLLGALRAEVWQRNSQIFKSRYCTSVPVPPLITFCRLPSSGYVDDAQIKVVRLNKLIRALKRFREVFNPNLL